MAFLVVGVVGYFMLKLALTSIPADHVVGSYGPNGDKVSPRLKWDQLATVGSMPARALFLHPEAASSYVHDLHPAGVAVSDMYRSAESSLHAVASGRGAQPPGFSAHNYGLAIDIRVADTLKRLRASGTDVKTKHDLDAWFRGFGWYCHRTDGAMAESESWHYNALMVLDERPTAQHLKKIKSTSGWVEEAIRRLYRDQLMPDDRECQSMLASQGFYRGELDGIVGPQTRSALSAFQRAWVPAATTVGKLDDRTRRTLAFLTAERDLQPLATS